MASFHLCSIRKKISYQNWSYFKIYDKLLPVLCSIRKKTSYQKWSCFKIYGNLLPVQHKKKKTSYQKWSCFKIYGKYKVFLMTVYMIFKYSKRFRFAPSFNQKIKFWILTQKLHIHIYLATQHRDTLPLFFTICLPMTTSKLKVTPTNVSKMCT